MARYSYRGQIQDSWNTNNEIDTNVSTYVYCLTSTALPVRFHLLLCCLFSLSTPPRHRSPRGSVSLKMYHFLICLVFLGGVRFRTIRVSKMRFRFDSDILSYACLSLVNTPRSREAYSVLVFCFHIGFLSWRANITLRYHSFVCGHSDLIHASFF